MRAIIIGAGRGRRLMPTIENAPILGSPAEALQCEIAEVRRELETDEG